MKLKNFKPKKCFLCKNIFIPNHPRNILCSNKCQQARKIKYMKKYSLEHTPRKGYGYKNCKVCDISFLSNNARELTCSIICKKKYKSNYDKLYHPIHPYSKRFCEVCSIQFQPNNQQQLTCGKRECKLKLKKIRHKQNEEYEKIQKKEYGKSHRKKFNDLMKTNLNYKIRKRLNNRLSFTLKRLIKKNIKSKKNSKIEKLLGCSISEFIKYIESQFKEGMTWNNYGIYGWHLDHIIPCSFFNLSNPEHQRLCFCYGNFQPLWAKENLSKNNKINISEVLDNFGLIDEGLI